ncbi:MAG: hypothetical protein K0U16_07695 [Gammaproteobacteria bacterium]|nr:hypothetical protein [Gammaproteobacteria bacterium]
MTEYTHRYTWHEGQIPEKIVRSIRKLCFEWKIRSKLRRSAGEYRLTFFSPTVKGLKFARHIYETAVAIEYTDDEAQVIKIIEDSFVHAQPPVEHLARSFF